MCIDMYVYMRLCIYVYMCIYRWKSMCASLESLVSSQRDELRGMEARLEAASHRAEEAVGQSAELRVQVEEAVRVGVLRGTYVQY
jgi:hypothetical protein